MKPIASIVVISDYKVGSSLAWDDLRATLRGLAAQNFAAPVEHIFLETVKHKDYIPQDLTKILPGLKIILSRQELQYALKSEAARVAQSDIVILLDGDCVPSRAGSGTWLTRCDQNCNLRWLVEEPCTKVKI